MDSCLSTGMKAMKVVWFFRCLVHFETTNSVLIILLIYCNGSGQTSLPDPVMRIVHASGFPYNTNSLFWDWRRGCSTKLNSMFNLTCRPKIRNAEVIGVILSIIQYHPFPLSFAFRNVCSSSVLAAVALWGCDILAAFAISIGKMKGEGDSLLLTASAEVTGLFSRRKSNFLHAKSFLGNKTVFLVTTASRLAAMSDLI